MNEDVKAERGIIFAGAGVLALYGVALLIVWWCGWL